MKFIADEKWRSIHTDVIPIQAPERIKEESNPIVLISTKKEFDKIRNVLVEWGLNTEQIIVDEDFLRLPACTREEIELDEEFIGYYEELKVLLAEKDMGNIKLVRTGRDYDGGYLMADSFANGRVAYSFGIADDIS